MGQRRVREGRGRETEPERRENGREGGNSGVDITKRLKNEVHVERGAGAQINVI